MRRTLALLTASAALLALASCGLDKRGDVVVVGAGPSGESDGTTSGGNEPDGWSEQISDPKDLVLRWLAAAAGDYGVENARQVAIARARSFLDPTVPSLWDPSKKQLKVVRLLRDPQFDPQRSVATIEVQHVGVLTHDGKLDPPGLESPTEYSFKVSQPTDKGYYLQVLPEQDLLLSDTALKNYYNAVTLYYGTADNRQIPDIRYLSQAIQKPQHNTRKVEWLLGEPSNWLNPVVEQRPAGAKLIGNVTTDGDSLVIDLSQEATPYLERLKKQFALSLDAQTIKLKIVGQEKATASRPAPEARPSPARYGVVAGTVVSLPSGQAIGKHKNVKSVAFSRGSISVALVVQGARGQSLYVGDPAAPTPVPLLKDKGNISQPIWLDHGQQTVLVLADGELWRVQRTGAAKQIELPGKVRAESISVGPDGLRIAYLVNKQLFLAPLARSGDEVSVPPAGVRKVPITLTELQSVAFATEGHLIVAGTKGSVVQLTEVTIDGAAIRETKRNNYTSGTKITHLVAYPVSGSDRQFRDADLVMFVIDQKAYDGVYAGNLKPIDIGPTVAPSPKPTASPRAQTVTSPSFEG